MHAYSRTLWSSVGTPGTVLTCAGATFVDVCTHHPCCLNILEPIFQNCLQDLLQVVKHFQFWQNLHILWLDFDLWILPKLFWTKANKWGMIKQWQRSFGQSTVWVSHQFSFETLLTGSRSNGYNVLRLCCMWDSRLSPLLVLALNTCVS